MLILFLNLVFVSGLLPSKNVNTWDTGVKRVMKQVEEPNAKRVKREPSPAMSHMKPKLSQSSSVLMNLLVSGCDVDAGYICMVQCRPRNKPQAKA